MLLISRMHDIKPKFKISNGFSETNAFQSIKSNSSFQTGCPWRGPPPAGIDGSLCSDGGISCYGIEVRVRERTAELNAYMAKLEQSNQALQDFASIAAH